MESMSALVFHEPGRISLEERPIPEVGIDDVLVQVGAASVCASDIRVYKGEKYAKPGVIPGHEMTGEVVKVGEHVDEVQTGDRVVVCPIIACGECYFCLLGRRNRCLKRITLGYRGRRRLCAVPPGAGRAGAPGSHDQDRAQPGL